jgi:hypothetical protein
VGRILRNDVFSGRSGRPNKARHPLKAGGLDVRCQCGAPVMMRGLITSSISYAAVITALPVVPVSLRGDPVRKVSTGSTGLSDFGEGVDGGHPHRNSGAECCCD